MEWERNCHLKTGGGNWASIRGCRGLEGNYMCHMMLSTSRAALQGENTLDSDLTCTLHRDCLGMILAPDRNGEDHLGRVRWRDLKLNTCYLLQRQ